MRAAHVSSYGLFFAVWLAVIWPPLAVFAVPLAALLWILSRPDPTPPVDPFDAWWQRHWREYLR